MEGMTPRIVVPDSDDMGTVVAALVQYSHGVVARAMLNGDFSGMIDEQKIVIGLLEDLRDQAVTDRAAEVFGAVPSDEEIAQALREYGKEFGSEGTGF